MGNRQNSSSHVQNDMEKTMIRLLSKQIGMNFECNKVIHVAKCKVLVDFFSESDGVIGEVYAHVGKAKGAQTHKIANDILKMIYIDKKMNTIYEKIFVVNNEELQQQLIGSSWLSDVIRTFGIKVVNVGMCESDLEKIRQAQKTQSMSNTY